LAGIYLHIPFCKQACAYCNFHFSTSLRVKDELISSLVNETKMESAYLQNETIDSIYLGGGTPSLLTIEDCSLLLKTIRQYFIVSENAEITIEANPDDVNKEKLREWKQIGINRLSIGVQSFFEDELRWMNRAHNAQHARQCIEWSLQEGFTNLTIDLIYGSPLLTDDLWKQNIDIATGYGISHLSCYALTVEEKTPLQKLIQTEKATNVDNDKQARQFLLLMQWMKEKGYEHYEVSNFAKPNSRSRHNSSYWKGEKYLGLGPSAHSYNGAERRWNVANNNIYISGINKGLPKRETEILSSKNRLNESIMISLRTKEGLDLDKIEKEWGSNEKKRINQRLQKFTKSGLISVNNSIAQLTDEGMLLADGIASDLFI